MPVYKNKAQKVFIYAQYLSGTTWTAKTGDAGNITAKLSKDGAAAAATNDVNPSEVDSGDNPGWYAFDMLATETNCDFMLLTASSVTSGVIILPVGIYTSDSMGVLAVGSKTLAECIELIMAMSRLAKNSGFPAGPCVMRNLADTADVATITFDANGNVTNVVIA